ncbi:hypothetical protein PybrP1_002558 [[Pythium] brassicae (nom. inval.)]|nr:hypothetical protein PybrP1_002558 [[Pythium] brassicae (nom. inval.)]
MARSNQEELERVDASKDALVARIKRNFALETQTLQRRIRDATDAAVQARERVDAVQEELRVARATTRKLKAQLAERDATLRFLDEQQDTALLLRGVQRHLGANNQVLGTSLAISKTREAASDRAALDERFHEYETQIAQLYTEIQNEQQKNAMLRECLREQKLSKAKLMKACRLSRQEVEALKSSGLQQLLEDMQGRYQALEGENERLMRDLAEETSKAREAHESVQTISRSLASAREAQRSWEEALVCKDNKLAECREQIRAQQVVIENLQLDLCARYVRRSSFGGPHESDDTQEETERSRLSAAEHEIRAQRTKAEALERQLRLGSKAAAQRELSDERGALLSAAHSKSESLNELLALARQLRSQVDALSRLVRSCKETERVDIQLLAGDGWWCEDASIDDIRGRLSLVDDASESDEHALRQELLLAMRSLRELQQMVDDACATALGNSCALQ